MTNFEDKILKVLNEDDVPPINLFLFLVQFTYYVSHDISISVSRELTPLELSLVEMIGSVRDSLKPHLDKLEELKEQYFDDEAFEVRVKSTSNQGESLSEISLKFKNELESFLDFTLEYKELLDSIIKGENTKYGRFDALAPPLYPIAQILLLLPIIIEKYETRSDGYDFTPMTFNEMVYSIGRIIKEIKSFKIRS